MEFALNLIIILADQMMLFFINLIVARSVGEALFGNFTAATNGLLLLGTLCTLGLDSVIAYYIPKFYVRKQFQHITQLTESIKSFLMPIYTSVITIGLLLCLGLIGITLSFDKMIAFDIAHPIYFFIWGVVSISAYNILVQLFRTINYMRTAVLLSLLQTGCYFITSLFIYFYLYHYFFPTDLHYFPHVMVLGFLTSYFIVAIIAKLLYRRSIFKKNIPYLEAHDYSWRDKIYGYTIQNLNIYIFSAIPLLNLEWVGHNEHSVGLFSAVISIISLAFIAIRPIGILIAPEISAAFAQSRQQLIYVVKKYLIVCVSIAAILTLIIGLFANHILHLYRSNFIDALPYTYISLINILLFSISMPLTKMIQNSAHGSAVGAKITLYFLLGQMIASFIFVKWLGLTGAIICYVGINIVYNLAMLLIARYILHHQYFTEDYHK